MRDALCASSDRVAVAFVFPDAVALFFPVDVAAGVKPRRLAVVEHDLELGVVPVDERVTRITGFLDAGPGPRLRRRPRTERARLQPRPDDRPNPRTPLRVTYAVHAFTIKRQPHARG